MTAHLIEKQQFLRDGEPVSGASIYIGAQNLDPQANPITIYSDRALTVTLANPQLTDSQGRPTNKIWVPGAYSIEVYDTDLTLVYQDLDAGGSDSSSAKKLTNVLGTNAITAEGEVTLAAIADKDIFVFRAPNTNTGAMTLTIDATTEWPVVKNTGEAFSGGEITAGANVFVSANTTESRYELVGSTDQTLDIKQAQMLGVAIQVANMTAYGGGSAPTEPINDVIYAESRWVTVGDTDGTEPEIRYSTDDGVTFNVPSTVPNDDANLNALARQGGRFVAVGQPFGGDALVLWSNDATNWVEISTTQNVGLKCAANNADESIFVALGTADGSDTFIISSTDITAGATERSAPANILVEHVAFGAVNFVAGGAWDGTQPYVIRSSDGESWSQSAVAGAPTDSEVNGLAYGNSMFLMATNSTSSSTDKKLWQSLDDGISWTDITANLPLIDGDTIDSLSKIAFHSGQGVFILRVDRIGEPESILLTPDGVNWRQAFTPAGANQLTANAFHYANGSLFAVGDQLEILQSDILL